MTVETIIMPIIERALAAERAAALMACANRARASKISIPSLDPNEWTTGFNQGCEAAYCEIETLPRDRSTLDDALAQARREQQEKDLAIARKHCSGKLPEDWPHQSWCGCEVAAAILAQED